VIAIDPGQSGGIAVLLPGQAATAFKMPATDGELLQKLRIADAGTPNKTAYLESLVLFTGVKIPGSRGIKYGASWGKVYGMLFALEFRVICVPPQKWITILGLGKRGKSTKTQWKNKLKNEAERLYPGLDVTLATADALLILEAAKRGALG
jgi:hypothetical protein